MSDTSTQAPHGTDQARSNGLSRGVLLAHVIPLVLGVVLLVLALTAIVPVGAFALSEGRVYEMVSPLYKGGYGATIAAVSPNGENVAFDSLGIFAGLPLPEIGAYYLAHRETGNGWTITPLQPPFKGTDISDFSSSLEYALINRVVGFNEVGNIFDDQFSMHRVGTPDTAESWVGIPVILHPAEPLYMGQPSFIEAAEKSASSDLCHIVVEGFGLLPEAPLFTGISGLYDLARGCGGEEPSLRLVEVRNSLGPNSEPAEFKPADTCKVFLGFGSEGSERAEQHAKFQAISGDGSEIFFTTSVEPGKECGGAQLFVRVGGSRTVEVSRPVEPSLPFGGCGEGGGGSEVPGEVPCPVAVPRPSAFFKGAAEDGSKVFFTSDATLVSGDTDQSNKLFMARIGCPESEPGCEPAQRRVTGLVDASKSSLAGENAEVQGVVSMGREADYVYFVARGVLTDTPNGEGVMAVKGADNLYAYDSSTGNVAFIGDLCSNGRLSGDSADVGCPSGLSGELNDTGLWGKGDIESQEAQSTPDGRFLVLSTFARLIVRGPQADTDNARDVYRYDAETGVLDRVSVGEGGHDANGNDSAFPATIETQGTVPDEGYVTTQQELATRAISDDGSRIVFRSAEPLSSDAINGHENVYIWHKQPGWSEGRVSLISSGSSLTNDNNPVITTDGMSVFFETAQGLVPTDTEHDLDVYDARVGGGFPASPVEREPCSSDACQGALTNPAPLLVPGSAAQTPGQNYAPPPVLKTVKKKIKKTVKKRKAESKNKARRAKTKAGRTGEFGKGLTSGGSRTVVLGSVGRGG